jgi:hypothetical protein
MSEKEETIGNKRVVLWTTEHEDILIEWADKAMCYRWLHSNANALYSYKNTWYTIPVIVISTVTGTANFAQERVPIEYQTYFVMMIGAFNILAGIITTIQQFLKITQLNEAHRVATIAWDKFYRNIKIQLAKHPDERIEVSQMLKMAKEEFDRLIETSPNIPENVVAKFKMQFQNSPNFKEIKKPEICDELVSTQNMRNQWYTNNSSSAHFLSLPDKEEIMKRQIIEFKKDFFKMNGRQPLAFEMVDNLKENVEVKQMNMFQQLCNELEHSNEIELQEKMEIV